ncbi:MAG: kinase [Abditibacteriota bacterium]|nr:kinase [Abditibacteriota bacterium]
MKTLGIFAAPGKPNVPQLTQQIIDLASARGIETRVQQEVADVMGRADLCCASNDEIARCDTLITLSGDGGVLKAARFAAPHGTPILAVDLGRLGFLSAVRPTEIKAAFNRLVDGEFEIEERMMLDARVLRRAQWPTADQSNSTTAATTSSINHSGTGADAQPQTPELEGSIGLNDAVVAKSALARILRLSIYVGDDLVAETRADGLVISTPTGSTAYALSAGGPIVHPSVPLMLICPICPHSIAQRPFVVGPDETVEIHAEWEGDEVLPETLEAMLTIDGQVGVTLRSGDRVRVVRSPLCARLMQPPEGSFFTRLRQKLHWN